MPTRPSPRPERNAAGHVRRWRLRACLTIIDVAGVLVPRAQRDEWRREWRAELWYRSQLGAAESPIASLRVRRRRPASPTVDLMTRSLGSIRHALWLRSQEWKPDMLLQDLRYAVRALRMAPTFTIMALLTLGIGIGANAVVFNMLDSVLLTPYPFEEPEQIVDVYNVLRDRGGAISSLSYPTYLDIRDAGIFDDIAVWDWEPMNLRGDDETLLIGVGQVTPSLFNVMRVEPIVGRAFTADEDVPGQGGVVLLTEGFWRSQYGGDPDVVGTTILLDARPRVIIGVMPAEYAYPDDEIQAWVPLGVTTESAPRSANWLGSLARMQPGWTIEQTNAALRPLAQRIEQEHPDFASDRGLAVRSLRDARVGEVRPMMYLLLGAVGFLLLIVCANVANLLLARASTREREISVRLALGASRTRLVRQLLTESMLLSLGGLAVGFAFSNWAVNTLLATIPDALPVWIQVRTNFADVAYMASVALAATILFGLVPALQATRPDVRGTLSEASGRASGGRGRRLIRSSLVVAEVALSLMLLAGAGLMARSFTELSNVDPGFATDNRLMATMQMPRGKYTNAELRLGLYHRMMQRLAAMPGVESVAAISRMPIRHSTNTQWFMVEGQDADEARGNPSALHNAVSPRYFDTMGIPLLAGRSFDDRDAQEAPRVVLVNQQVVDRYFADGDVLGRRISFDAENWWEIVGVVGSVRHFGLAVPPDLQVYVPYEQNASGRLSIVLHTQGDPAEMAPQLRAAVRDIDPDQALYDVMTLNEAVAEDVWDLDFFTSLMRAFAVIAAAIAAVGIYGVTSYSVSRRTQELGVRMALGAERSDITRMVIRQSMDVVAVGIGIGLLLAVAEGTALQSLLYEVSGTDPATFARVVALVVGVSLLAAWLPARRATRLDPVRALRDE